MPGTSARRLQVLMYTDLVNNATIRHILKDDYRPLKDLHDTFMQNALDRVGSYKKVKTLGDGFFIAFDSVRDAITTALLFQWQMLKHKWGREALKSRVGMHLGDVEWRQTSDGGLDTECSTADLAHRVMTLALGGQILFTGAVYCEGIQGLPNHPVVATDPPPGLRWVDHGKYKPQGFEEMNIFEVGAEGVAHFRRPNDVEKVKAVGHDERAKPIDGSKGDPAEDWLLEIAGYRIEYIPLINGSKIDPRTKAKPPISLAAEDVAIHCIDAPFKLSAAFESAVAPERFRDEASCRLAGYDPDSRPLSLEFSETSYGDYLKSSAHLDDPLPDDPAKTFRDRFGSLVRQGATNLRPFDLTNICGAGVFIVSRKGDILLTKHSEESHVYPGRWTFSASGTLKWGAYPHPFTEAVRPCFHEINHQVDPNRLSLIGFGIDARKLFFQFSLVERSDEEMGKLKGRVSSAQGHPDAPLDYDFISLHSKTQVFDFLVGNFWEPAAEAALLTLCIIEFGRVEVEHQLSGRRKLWTRRQMRDEWDYRASRPGLLPDMTPRYPVAEREKQSRLYVERLASFMGDDICGKNVLEVGAGTGRLTEQLLQSTGSAITVVEFCERMVGKHRKRIARIDGGPARVEYVEEFAQDYAGGRHDVAICSLVLIHNTVDEDFDALVRSVCQAADEVFVFEDVSEGRITSRHTRIRPENLLVEAFAACGFSVRSRAEHFLYTDKIVLLKFAKAKP